MSTNAALNPDGTLKDASEMDWQFSEGDEEPIKKGPTAPSGTTDPVDVSSDDELPSAPSKGKQSARVVAGARRPIRATRPSWKAREGGGLHPLFSRTVTSKFIAVLCLVAAC